MGTHRVLNKQPTRDEVINALEGSVAKWRGICFDEKEERSTVDCPLCHLFYGLWRDEPAGTHNFCGRCPVKLKTGLSTCRGSPYEEWVGYQDNMDRGRYAVFDDKSADLAQKELSFLEMLLAEYREEKGT